jgi:transposase
MKKSQGLSRRRYSAAEKARIMAACEEPGAAIAAVAQAHGVKASLVHHWRYVANRWGWGQILPFATFPLQGPTLSATLIDSNAS